MNSKKGKKLALLLPDEAGIIRAERPPKSSEICTIRDLREALFNSALYVEQCAREYIDDPPPEVDAAYIDAMQNLIDKGEYLRSLVDDAEINKMPVPTAEKIWALAVSALFIGRMEQLAELAPILSKEQITRELYAMMREGFTAAATDRAEIKDKIDQKEKAAARRPILTQEDAASIILRVKGKDETKENIRHAARTIQNWERFLRTKGKKGTTPPRGYSRDYTVDRFKFWVETHRDEILLREAVHNARPLRDNDGATTDE